MTPDEIITLDREPTLNEILNFGDSPGECGVYQEDVPERLYSHGSFGRGFLCRPCHDEEQMEIRDLLYPY